MGKACSCKELYKFVPFVNRQLRHSLRLFLSTRPPYDAPAMNLRPLLHRSGKALFLSTRTDEVRSKLKKYTGGTAVPVV